jgi:hypothetical protein
MISRINDLTAAWTHTHTRVVQLRLIVLCRAAHVTLYKHT